jgi:hypothetical protein
MDKLKEMPKDTPMTRRCSHIGRRKELLHQNMLNANPSTSYSNVSKIKIGKINKKIKRNKVTSRNGWQIFSEFQ